MEAGNCEMVRRKLYKEAAMFSSPFHAREEKARVLPTVLRDREPMSAVILVLNAGSYGDMCDTAPRMVKRKVRRLLSRVGAMGPSTGVLLMSPVCLKREV